MEITEKTTLEEKIQYLHSLAWKATDSNTAITQQTQMMLTGYAVALSDIMNAMEGNNVSYLHAIEWLNQFIPSDDQ